MTLENKDTKICSYVRELNFFLNDGQYDQLRPTQTLNYSGLINRFSVLCFNR